MQNSQIEWGISELMNLKLFTDNWPVDKEILTSFLDVLISNAKARTHISEKDIKEHNKEFYDYLDNYFKENKNLSVGDNSEDFRKMCLMFKVPVTKNNLRSEEDMILGDVKEEARRGCTNVSGNPKGSIPMKHEEIGFLPENQIYTHKDCMEIFNKLSTEEKIKFVVNFQNVEIKLSPSDILVIKSL